MSSLSATQSDGYYLPPEYFESGAYKKKSRNRFAAESANNKNGSGKKGPPIKVGHNQWLKHGVVRFELPEKVVCFGCKQSIGRGTRYNARKIKTDQFYFTTPIVEFNLSCRNCKEPWVIRTDPKERGFEYVSGVKRQAGQDRNLIEEGVASAAVVNSQRTSLDALEAAAVKKTNAKRTLTELEELEGLVKLNQSTNAGGNDVDHNASIRKAFRMDRREKRKTLVEGKQLGWKKGMALLQVNDGDILHSKEASYGNASKQERAKLSNVRKSSIFESSRQAKNHKRMSGSSRSSSSAPDTIVSAAAPDPVLSTRKLPEASPELISSSTNSATSSSIPRKRKLVVSNGLITKSSEETTAIVSQKANSMSKIQPNNQTNDAIAPEEIPNSLLDLVGAYGSSSEDDD